MRNIGVLTSGGDAPGMNAAIRAIVKSAFHYGVSTIGIMDGFEGLITEKFLPLKYRDVDNIIQRGGTMLGTARSPEFRTEKGREKAIQNIQKESIDALIVIGGDGSLAGAHALSKNTNIPIIGLPATIDNDLYGTYNTIGYDTALNTIVSAIDNIRDTAYSSKHIFFVEVMGRDSGFLALNSAIASGAEAVLIPETISDIQGVAEQLRIRNKGRLASIIIVAEGDEEGGAFDIIKKIKPFLPNFELRGTILGHLQRGGNPSYFDRSFATRAGVMAVELVQQGITDQMIGIKADQLYTVPLQKALSKEAIPDLEKEKIIEKLLTR